MFAKIFTQIFDSSIADDPSIRYGFMDLIVLADCEGVVDMTPEAISRRTNVPLETVTTYLVALASPDPRSRSSDDHGARIRLLDSHRDWGWQIVNYDHYRSIRDEDSRRAYFRDRKRAQRQKAPPIGTMSKTVQDSHHLSPHVTGGHRNSTKEEGEGEGDLEGVQPQTPSRVPRVPPAPSGAAAPEPLVLENQAAVRVPALSIPQIPDALKTSPECVEWWGKWLQHLKAKRKSPSVHAQELQLHKLAVMGPARAIETLKNSIEHNWQGLYEPNHITSNGANNPRNRGLAGADDVGKADRVLAARKAKAAAEAAAQRLATQVAGPGSDSPRHPDPR